MLSATIDTLLPSFLARFKGRDKIAGILKNVGWLSGDRILRMGVALIVGVWVARYLGADQFGLLNYSVAFVSLLTPLATLGLDSVVVRNLVQTTDQTRVNETMGTAFALKLCGGVVAFATSSAAIYLLRADALTRIVVAIIALGSVFQAFDAIDFWFQSQVRSKFSVCARSGAFILMSATKIVLLKMHAPLIAFAWTSVGEIVLGSAGLILGYKLARQTIHVWSASLTCAKTLLAESWPLMLTGILIFIYMRIDQIMLGQMLDDKAVGLYSAAVRIAELWYFLPMTITSSVFPALVEAKKSSVDSYNRRLQTLFSSMAALGYAVVLPTALLSHHLILWVFGKGYSGAGTSLLFLSGTFLFVCLGLVTQSWMICEGLMRLPLMTTALGAGTNIALNFALIPKYGPTGAAAATLISQFISVTVAALVFPESRAAFKMQMRGLILKDLIPSRGVTAASPPATPDTNP